MKTPSDPEEQVELAGCNTLRLPATARYFARISKREAIPYWLDWAREHELPVLALGGGSNLVLGGDFRGLVLKIALCGRHWTYISEHEAELTVGSGENWHDTVMYTVELGYRGLENLALIPGSAGAAPVQNIGAYGAELADVLVSVEAYDRDRRQWCSLDREACRFAYRDSVFKRHPDRFLITAVRVRLSRTRGLRLGYRDLANWFRHRNLNPDQPEGQIDAADVARAVIAIRQEKLPDPATLPNAGSFFKNPVIAPEQFTELESRFPEIVSYPDPDGVKLAAGWLIEQCGWKGFRNSRVGVHSRQALVLVNLGEGTGADILELAGAISRDVKEKFGVELEIEPRVVGGEGLDARGET